ncbi:MAG: YbaB/EbfC family nucleoid-associated protein [Actinomycetota bacterium]|nr:YbaB/EbfC family nucleoid-associated protein [Actinomycetota bacterium]
MGRDLQKMMKQAQEMAAEMQKAQEGLADIKVEGSAGGGAVKVTATGDLQITGVTIDAGFFDGEPDPDDLEMLGDTITAAVNDALANARAAQEKALGPIAGGFGLPGGAGGLGLGGPGGL